MQSSGASAKGGTTRDRVAHSILVYGPSTAAQLAQRLDMTPAGVRRHLDQLEAEGAVVGQSPPRQRRGRGRPAKVFALTDTGRHQFDQHYDDLAVQALRFLAETGGPEALRAFAEQRAALIKQEFGRVLAQTPELDRADALAAALSRQGYAATVHDHTNGEQLCQRHCPVSHVANEFPQLCEAETAVISELLGSHVQRLATIAQGSNVCTTYIPDPIDASSATTSLPVSTSSNSLR